MDDIRLVAELITAVKVLLETVRIWLEIRKTKRANKGRKSMTHRHR